MEPLSTLVLFGIGLGLIAIEAMMMIFFVVWIGLGFLITSIINFIYPLESFWYQIGTTAVIALILFALFYKPLKRLLNKAEEVKDDFIQDTGIGTIKNNMLSYQGTYFQVVNMDISNMDNTKVNVTKIDKNSAWIELIK